MRTPALKRLQRDERLREFLYHIRGIIEATDNIEKLMTELNSTFGRDVAVFADTASLLEVQALHHLGYHVKALRTPLSRLQREAYEQLEENGKGASRGTRKRSVNPNRKPVVHRGRGTAAASSAKK